MRTQGTSEVAITHNDIGFLVHKQAEAIVIAGTNRGPMVIDDRDLAMQLRLAILDYSHPGLQQMRIVGTSNQILKTVLANTQQQCHINAAPGSNSQALAHLAAG